MEEALESGRKFPSGLLGMKMQTIVADLGMHDRGDRFPSKRAVPPDAWVYRQTESTQIPLTNRSAVGMNEEACRSLNQVADRSTGPLPRRA
jgi:hypothetical protein